MNKHIARAGIALGMTVPALVVAWVMAPAQSAPIAQVQVIEAIEAPGPASVRTQYVRVQVPVEVPVEVVKTVEVPVKVEVIKTVEKIVEVPVVEYRTAPVTVQFFEDGSYRVMETGQGDCPPMVELLCNSEYWPVGMEPGWVAES